MIRTQVRLAALVTIAGLAFAARRVTAETPIAYEVDLRDAASHLVHVTMQVPEANSETEIQFPAWNALYQMRDFVRDVQDLQAQCDAKPFALTPVGLYTWSVGPRSCHLLTIRYSVYSDEPGVFSSQLIPRHAFLNPADLLFYIPGQLDQPDLVRFDLLPGWRLVTLLPRSPSRGAYEAADYAALADSPVEAGDFQLYSFQQGSTVYRVVVRAGAQGCPSLRLLKSIASITASETALMRDMPCSRYTFIFHFPREGGGGGMEHRCGAAIGFPAAELQTGWKNLEQTIAHEFFHLWNVKRIRPRGLEPVDYVRPSDTRDLWFSEGITNTYAELTLLRCGFIKRREFYDHIGKAIQQLQSRPARRFQSVELSGLEAWLEKYPDYERPERSISYYNKGELLGYLLDLAIRGHSGGGASLDDLMRNLDVNFAQRHRTFSDADLVSVIAALAPPDSWVQNFFHGYIYGTRELDYSKYLAYAGLELTQQAYTAPDWGFEAARGFDGLIRVTAVSPLSGAAGAGLQTGDILTQIDGQALYTPPQDVSGLKPGQRVELTVQRRGRALELTFNLGSRLATRFRVAEMKHATAEKIEIRRAWLKGSTAGPPNKGKP